MGYIHDRCVHSYGISRVYKHTIMSYLSARARCWRPRSLYSFRRSVMISRSPSILCVTRASCTRPFFSFFLSCPLRRRPTYTAPSSRVRFFYSFRNVSPSSSVARCLLTTERVPYERTTRACSSAPLRVSRVTLL